MVAPMIISLPLTPRPPATALMALLLVAVARMALAPPNLAQFRRRVLRLAINVMMGAQLLGQRLLVPAPGDGHGLKTHLGGELHAQMAESADPQNGHEIARPRPAVPQGIEGGDAGAHQRSRLHRRKLVGDQGQRRRRRNHVFGVAAVVGDAGYLAVLAGNEVAAPARIAIPAVSAIPADPDPLPDFPAHDARPQLHQSRRRPHAPEPGDIGGPGRSPPW